MAKKYLSSQALECLLGWGVGWMEPSYPHHSPHPLLDTSQCWVNLQSLQAVDYSVPSSTCWYDVIVNIAKEVLYLLDIYLISQVQTYSLDKVANGGTLLQVSKDQWSSTR